ncbi:hypothetical protein Q73_14280 [Bacillus coahuilensis m2-6]|nr:hypothetical protein [Bacillus coahuilensis]KUP05000.1 hypothetical protein Q73_14280 [Bacillus coahuilensis m2-6]
MLQTIFLNVSVLVFYVFVVQFLMRNKEKSFIFKLLLTMTTSFVALELHILSVSVDELQMLSLAPLVFLLSSLFIGRTISLFATFLLLGLHLLMLVDLLNGMIILFSSLVPSLLLQYVRSKK